MAASGHQRVEAFVQGVAAREVHQDPSRATEHQLGHLRVELMSDVDAALLWHLMNHERRPEEVASAFQRSQAGDLDRAVWPEHR